MQATLFISCVADAFYPDVGEAVVRILRRHGVRLRFPEAQTCCAQPAYNAGYHDEAKEVAAQLIDALDGDDPVVTPSGSCAAMVHHYYPSLFEDDEDMRSRAERLAERVVEFSQFMVDHLKVEDIGARMAGTAAYHSSCHMLRHIHVTDPPRRLLAGVRDLRVVDLPGSEECCGFGGAFAVKMPELSTAMADSKLDALESTGAGLLVGSDLACLMHMGGRARRRGMDIRPLHIASLLAEGLGIA